jgi:beta-glucosidase
VGETFGDLVFGWKPINEPLWYALSGYRVGAFPPGRRDAEGFSEALEAIHLASFDAWRLLHTGGKPVATIEGLMPIYPMARTRDPAAREEADARAQLFDDTIWCGLRAWRDGVLAVPGRAPIELPDMAGAFDLLGFSYYAAQAVYADGGGVYPVDAAPGPMDYAPWPEGLDVVLRRLADEFPGRSLLVDECGLGTQRVPNSSRDADDEARVAYLTDCLSRVDRALDDGVDIEGFFHWTAIDNYEWLKGYDVLFGLFDRDRNPKPSAELARSWAVNRATPT